MSSLDPDQLKARCAALRLPVNSLADLAGINKDTLHKIFNGTTMPRLDTLRAIVAALEAEERRVLAHLSALHPVPPVEVITPEYRMVLNGHAA
jgi:predicted transcriptional regulator